MLSTNTPLSSRIYEVNWVTPKMSSNLRAVHNREEARHCVDPSLFPGAHHDEDRGQQRNRHLTLGRKAEGRRCCGSRAEPGSDMEGIIHQCRA